MKMSDFRADEFQGAVLSGTPGEDIEDAARRAYRFVGTPIAMRWNDKMLFTKAGEEEEALVERWSVEVTGKTPAERKEALEAFMKSHEEATERMKARERAWESGQEPKPWEDWYARAQKQTSKTIGAFIDEVMSYDHDYNTVVMGVGACVVAAAWAANAHPENGGVTGFQSSFVMWEFIKNWSGKKGPMRLMEFEQMLYPQYEDRFEKEIARSTAEWLVAEAKKKLGEATSDTSPRTVEHWKKIAAGHLPFGFIVLDEP
jgi:hypothetical protein